MEVHRVRRRVSAAIFATALCATGLGLAPDAHATADVKSDRVAGQNRFETAAKVAAAAFPTGAKTVLVASGRAFPDALAGAALGFPILLTERDTLPAVTATAIDDLKADNAIILGGTAAVSSGVEDEVAKHASASRIAGNNRYETAAAIASSIGIAGVGTVGGKKTAIIATGLGFADALAGGPLATGAAGAGVLPILLVNDGVPAATSKAISDLGIKQAIILGGTSAVSSSVETEIEKQTGNDAVRLAGANRYGTAAVVGDYAIETLAFSAKATLLADGLDFADALAGGPFGGGSAAPLVLTDPAQLPDPSQQFFKDHSDVIETVTALGGTAAVSQSALAAAEKAAETPSKTGANQTIAVSPKAAANVANGSARDFTVTGLGTTIVDIALVPCDYVTTSSSGDTQFSNTNSNLQADGASNDPDEPVDEAETAAFISKVNGSTKQEDADHSLGNDDYANNVTPASGSITFSVTGPSGTSASACVVPTVFSDDNNDTSMNVNTTNPSKPTEAFGTGGATTFSPGAATNGAQFDVDVDNNDDSRNRFVGCDLANDDGPEIRDPSGGCLEYAYDDNDSFQLRGATLTLATFESKLSAGDDVHGTFNATPSGRSVFNLWTDEEPAPPSVDNSTQQPNPAAACTSATACSVKIGFAESGNNSVDSYRLYRTLKAGTADCPAFSSTDGSHTLMTPTDSKGVVSSEIDDRNPSDTPSADSQLSATDKSVSPGTTYCYRLVSVDDGDEGPPTDAIVASTPEQDAAGAPLINDASTTKADAAAVALGDTHTIVFNEVMDKAKVEAGSYTASGAGGGTLTVTCGSNALCTLASDNKTLTVRLGPPMSTGSPVYPLTITQTSGFKDLAGNEVDLAASPDKAIDNEAAS